MVFWYYEDRCLCYVEVKVDKVFGRIMLYCWYRGISVVIVFDGVYVFWVDEYVNVDFVGFVVFEKYIIVKCKEGLVV